MARELRAAGYTLVMPEVGELVTSLDMAGVSLTVTWLDKELEALWTAPAETPAYRRGNAAQAEGDPFAEQASEDVAGPEVFQAGKGRARPLAEKCVGTPDPGATSPAMIFTVAGPHLAAVRQPARARS